MAKISKHFTDKEFRCPDCGILFVDPELLSMLDQLRDRLGEPVWVTSGCRCPEYNIRKGGAKYSLHITKKAQPCRAADCKIHSPVYRYHFIEEAFKIGFGGIGIYQAHIHLDTRDMPTMWVD